MTPAPRRRARQCPCSCCARSLRPGAPGVPQGPRSPLRRRSRRGGCAAAAARGRWLHDGGRWGPAAGRGGVPCNDDRPARLRLSCCISSNGVAALYTAHRCWQQGPDQGLMMSQGSSPDIPAHALAPLPYAPACAGPPAHAPLPFTPLSCAASPRATASTSRSSAAAAPRSVTVMLRPTLPCRALVSM
jgi:hypothetical protein